MGLISTLWVGCKVDDDHMADTGGIPDHEEIDQSSISFDTHSLTPAFVYAMSGSENLEINTLISSED